MCYSGNSETWTLQIYMALDYVHMNPDVAVNQGSAGLDNTQLCLKERSCSGYLNSGLSIRLYLMTWTTFYPFSLLFWISSWFSFQNFFFIPQLVDRSRISITLHALTLWSEYPFRSHWLATSEGERGWASPLLKESSNLLTRSRKVLCSIVKYSIV